MAPPELFKCSLNIKVVSVIPCSCSCDLGSVMVVKKKAPRVEAVVLDGAELKSLTSESRVRLHFTFLLLRVSSSERTCKMVAFLVFFSFQE